MTHPDYLLSTVVDIHICSYYKIINGCEPKTQRFSATQPAIIIIEDLFTEIYSHTHYNIQCSFAALPALAYLA